MIARRRPVKEIEGGDSLSKISDEIKITYLRTEAVGLESRRDWGVVAAVEGVGVAAVVGGGEAEREALVVELVAAEEDPVRPRWPTPLKENNSELKPGWSLVF